MAYVRIWVHMVWSTRNRAPLIHSRIRRPLLDHIAENAKAKGIYIDSLGGDVDHLHALISLGGSQSIAKIAHLLKGESSHWMNKQEFMKSHFFEWQDDYFAVSVSESIVPRVRLYIKNQEAHHKKLSFEEEYRQFMDKHGFQQ